MFSGNGGVIAFSGTTLNASAIDFEAAGYSLSATSVSVPSAGVSFDVAGGVSATINSAISGTGKRS